MCLMGFGDDVSDFRTNHRPFAQAPTNISKKPIEFCLYILGLTYIFPK